MGTVDPPRPVAEDRVSRLEFESLISELPSRFMGAPPDQVDQGIVDALRRVCALLDLDLAVLAVVGV